MKFHDNKITIEEIKKYMPYIIRYRVSETARSKGQFIEQLTESGSVDKLPIEWQNKRRLFLIRSTQGYKKNPTIRRWLSLIAWAYWIEPKDETSKELKEKVESETKKEEKKEETKEEKKEDPKDLGEPSE